MHGLDGGKASALHKRPIAFLQSQIECVRGSFFAHNSMAIQRRILSGSNPSDLRGRQDQSEIFW